MNIDIKRSKNHKFGTYREMKVFVDGENVSTLKVGERVQFDVENPRLIWVKMDWCRSAKLHITKNEPNSFVCGEENNLWAFIATFLYPIRVFSLRKSNQT